MARDSFRSQLGPFAMVPVWVLEATRDATAVHLYAVLSRYANRERRAWPKHDRLARDLNVSDRSIRRALKILRDVGAVTTSPRRSADGTVDGTEYLLVSITANQRPPVAGSSPPVVAESASSTSLPATGGRSRRPPVAGAYKEEPDPLNQIQEQEERETPAAPPLPLIGSVFTGTVPNPNDPLEQFRVAWNVGTDAPPFKAVATLTPKRRRWIRAALALHSPETWHAIIARVNASSFCRGEKGWIATFDWLIKTPDSAVKVLEGQYDDHISEAELTEAAHWQFRVGRGAGCYHDPPCPDRNACLRETALSLRRRKAS